MSRNPHQQMPPTLQHRLERESPREQQELERTWGILGEHPPAPADAPDTDDAWQALVEELDTPADEPDVSSKHQRRSRRHQSRRQQRPPRPRQRMRRHHWRRLAPAVLVLMIGLGALLWQLPVHVSAPFGQHRMVVLPDGSTAELNSGATLSYRRGFSLVPFVEAHRRVVELHGEAFFEVRRAAARPFIVETFNARVAVRGTQFNVRADEDVHQTHVTLVTGRVQVTGTRPQEPSVELSRPGASTLVEGQAHAPIAPHPADLERVLTWRQDGFAVSNLPLPAIFARLEARYDVQLTFHDPATAAGTMTLYYPTRTSVETILHDICIANGLNYRSTSRGYEVYQAPDSSSVPHASR